MSKRHIYTIYTKLVLVGVFCVFLGIASHVNTAQAQTSTSTASTPGFTLEKLPDDINYHDFVVGPGKVELQIAPGKSQTVDLTVANRLGSDKVFQITEEDFTGSNDPEKSVVLLGSDRGPYSLKDDIHIPSTKVNIPFGYKARIPITVSVPTDAQPGGLYGSVLVSVVSVEGSTTSSGVGSTNPIITRIGTLFFVRVPGNVEADGTLTDFSLSSGHVIWSGSLTKTDPISFDLLFRNNGNVYLNPSGTISVTNMFGAPVGSIVAEPWFAMPQSLRFREVKWEPTFLFGRYVAHANINPGFGSSTESMDVVFWVIPWKIILIIFIGLIIIISGFKWIFSKFRIVTKK
jgi:hypothetical protein